VVRGAVAGAVVNLKLVRVSVDYQPPLIRGTQLVEGPLGAGG
jgi:hypothetical protein